MGGVLTSMLGIFGAASNTYIKSVQQVSITIATSATSNTATITSVDATKSFIILQQNTTTADLGANNISRCYVTLTNGTTVTATRNTSSGTKTVTINAVVIECTSGLLNSNVQYGTIAISAGTSNTATITSVSTSLAAVFYLGNSSTDSTDVTLGLGSTGVTLTNSTTVTANAGVSGSTTTSFVVVEFASAVIQSIQQFSDAFTTSNATDTKTITSVTANNSMIAWGGQKGGSNTRQAYMYALQLTSATNVNLVRGGTGATTRTAYYAVVEFKAGVLNSVVQRGIISIGSGATSNTATITSINTSRGFANLLGFNSNDSGFPGLDTVLVAGTLTNATTITSTRNSSDTNTVGQAYEAIEFIA